MGALGDRLGTAAAAAGVSPGAWLLAAAWLGACRRSGDSDRAAAATAPDLGEDLGVLREAARGPFTALVRRVQLGLDAGEIPACTAPTDEALFRELCEAARAGFAASAGGEGDEAVAQLRLLLQQTLEHPEAAGASYSLVTPRAARCLPDPTGVLARTVRPSVAHRFLEQAALRPQAPALCAPDRVWTYGELAATARGVAARLQRDAPAPGALIAVEGPRGAFVVACLLGAFLAGHPVLLLDPALPARRRARMLRESGDPLRVCPPGVAAGDDGPRLCLDLAELPAPTGALRESEPGPDDAATVFFTSGTTGVPKGVCGTHGGLAHFVDWQRRTFEVGERDRIAHVTGLSFDVVLREIFLALTSGAALCIPAEDQRLDPVGFVAWLGEERVTRLHAVPTVVGAWLDEAAPDTKLPHLRSLFFAGEPLPRSLVRRWRRTFGSPADVINLYGPTETTLAKCWYRVPDEPSEAVLRVGQALPEAQALVLTPARGMCGLGEPGEVWIRTPWRTRGYLNAPSPFVVSPFTADPDDLLYPTGDRGRFEPDGSLALLGRLDDQVKIRGVRVEPAEVAAALEEHPDVRAACVIAREVAGEKRLTACFVAQPRPATRELRRFLAGALPDAMIPAEFVALDRLPRTANGKVDRDALHALSQPAVARPDPVAPAGATERAIAAVWEEILEREPVGASEDFFDLGGDSLRALSCIARLRDRHGMAVAVTDLFEHRTVAELARHVDDAGRIGPAAHTPLVPVDRSGELPLAFAQERLWFQCQLEGEGSTAYNVPIAIAIRGALEVPVLERCLSEIVRRHESLRTSFPVDDGIARQRIGAPRPVPLARFDVRTLFDAAQTKEVERLCRAQAAEAFDLADPDAGLVRALLIARSDTSHVLHLTIHHLGFDGWSRWLLVRELGELYNAFSRGRPSPLRHPRIQYGDFAVWRRDNPPDESSLAHWRERLAGAPSLDLPTDRPRPRIQDFSSAGVQRVLPAELCEKLAALGRDASATLYMTLLTGFQILLMRWSGQADITVGTPLANRTRPELEELLGCFIDTLPLRSDLSGSPTFREALMRVRGVVLDAFEHSDLRFERLVQELRPQRDPSRHPVFDVMFNLVNVPRTPPELQALELSFPEIVVPEAHFALTLYAREWEGAVELRLVYQTALFDADRMERFLDEYEALLRAAAEAADRPLGPPRRGADPAPLPLPAPAAAPLRFAPPRTPMERRLAAIWSDLLGCDRISLHDNFFDLGGHSLLATRVLFRIRRALDLDLPLRVLFEHQTLGELAAAAEAAAHAPSREVPPGRPGAGAPAALSLGQRRLWDFARRYPESAHYNVPRAVRFRGPLDVRVLERALEQVVERHAVLRSGFDDRDGEPRARIRDSVALRLESVDARAAAGAFERRLADEIATPFDPTRDPLLRATLVRTAEDDHVLLVSAHHIVADCWSMGMPFGRAGSFSGRWMAGVFFRELWALYRALRAGRPSPLPELAWSFADAVALQNAWLDTDEARAQLAFWRRTLAGSPGPLVVPPDFERPAVWDFQGARPPLHLDRQLTRGLRDLGQRHASTLFATLLAAFDAVLQRFTGEDDILVGTTAANRARWEADDLIGFFSNNVLLRTSLAGDPTFDELLERTRATAFDAWSNQELPFERLVAELDGQTAADRHPLFQTRFILHQPDGDSFQEEGIQLTPLTTGREVAKYDLTLLLADDGSELSGWLEYATSLYAPETIERLGAALLAFAREAVSDPTRRLSEIWRCAEPPWRRG